MLKGMGVFLFLWFVIVRAEPPSYLQRETEVRAEYQKYLNRFQKDFILFEERLRIDAPELLEKLIPLKPQKIKSGYQILPRIKKDQVRFYPEEQKIMGEIYSWPLTEAYIREQIPLLQEMEEKINIIEKVSLEKRKHIYKKMIDETLTMRENQKTVDSHIRYNSFWQGAIDKDKPRFDEMTKMYDLVLERQAILTQIKNHENPYLLSDLKNQASDILEKTHHAIDSQMKLAPFVKIIKKSKTWIIQVPLYTDIEDQRFLTRFQSITEKKWSLEPFRLKLEIKHIQKNTSFPHPNDPVNIEKLLKHFPKNGGILTTGAITTYASAQRYIQLGPEDITENALAHEFGHILGFVDGYFRGYHDLGKQGYEVLEIIADPDDIMSSPVSGKAQPHHFEQMLGLLR